MVFSNIKKSSLDLDVERLLRYQRNELGKERFVEEQLQNKIRELLYPSEKDVFEVNAYQMGNVPGEGTTFGVTFTYGGRILLLDTLKGEDRKIVLEHEKHHRENPMDSEFMTRLKTHTLDFYPNQSVSACGCYN